MAKGGSNILMKCLVEFIGTFIFLSVIITTGEAIPIGLILAGVIYWGGSVSGGNYNPAVSVMMLLAKKINPVQCGMYIIAQLLGAAMAFYYFKITPKTLIAKR